MTELSIFGWTIPLINVTELKQKKSKLNIPWYAVQIYSICHNHLKSSTKSKIITNNSKWKIWISMNFLNKVCCYFVNTQKAGRLWKSVWSSSGPKLLFKGFRFPVPHSLSEHELYSTVNQGEHTKQRPVLNVNETNKSVPHLGRKGFGCNVSSLCGV